MQRAVATKISSFAISGTAAGLFAIAIQRHTLAFEGIFAGITIDEMAIRLVVPAFVFLAIFVGGHFALRRVHLEARLVYSLLGAVGFVASTAISAPAEVYASAIEQGVMSVLIVLTIALGSLVGFIYVRSAGFESDEDESEQVAQAHRLNAVRQNVAKTFGPAGLTASDRPQSGATRADVTMDDNSLIATEQDEFFDGPLRVVTSTRALFLAAFAGGFAHTFYATFVSIVFGTADPRGQERFMEQVESGEMIVSIGTGLIFSIVICLMLITPAVFALHKLLQSRKITDMGSYVVWGAVAPVGLGLLMFVIGILFTHWFVLPLAVAMGVYRHLAGLEPDALPEDILVRDRRTLVGKDHVRRRTHRVIG